MVQLTEEQELVAGDVLDRGFCCIVTAVPGAGKTTLAVELASRAPDRKILVVTYNKVLEVGLTQAAKNKKIPNLRASTIHGLLSKQSGRVCRDDSDMHAILEDPETVYAPLPDDLVVFDESQDLRPSFVRALRSVLQHRAIDSLSMIVCGDTSQMLYDYKTLGADRADSKYLLNAQQYFGFATGEREWTRRTLSWSFRLTPNMAAFLNAFWGRSDMIVGANTRVPNRPVTLICTDPYKDDIVQDIEQSVHEYGREQVLIVGHSTKPGTPVNSITNSLHAPAYMKTEGSADEDELANKVHVLTACASKGAEYKAVWFIGFEVFSANRMMTVNQACVGLSRASEELYIVCHNKNWLYPVAGDLSRMAESYAVLRDLRDAGVVKARYIPGQLAIPPQVTPIKSVFVTDCMRINVVDLAQIKSALCDQFSKRVIAVDKRLMKYTVGKTMMGVYWDISDLYGDAIPFAFQALRGVPPPTILSRIMAAQIWPSNLSERLYTYQDVVKAAAKDKFIVTDVDSWEGAISRDELGEQLGGGLHRGDYQIEVFERHCRKSAEFLDKFRSVCMADGGLVSSRGADIWIYLAAACKARNGQLNRFKYMGSKPSAYKWGSGALFGEALRVMNAEIPVGGTFERPLSFESDDGLPTLRGVADWVDAEASLLYEFKFCADLSEEHRLQTCIYAGMLAVELGRPVTGVLLNIRSGEVETYVVTPTSAKVALSRIVRLQSPNETNEM